MEQTYSIVLVAELFFAIFVFIVLFKISAPYGKFLRSGWGKSLPARYSWLIMESPAVLTMFILFYTGQGWQDPAKIVFLIFWQLHYMRRTFIYPFQISSPNKKFPVILMIFALFFNCMNGFINGYEVFNMNHYSIRWLQGPLLYAGIIIFFVGYRINKRSDNRLRQLKGESNGNYKLPKGGMFDQVSCPHYLGEIIEWLGWAVMTWSVSGFVFFLFTIANLAPRAYTTHLWYKNNFPYYPEKRRILIPKLW